MDRLRDLRKYFVVKLREHQLLTMLLASKVGGKLSHPKFFPSTGWHEFEEPLEEAPSSAWQESSIFRIAWDFVCKASLRIRFEIFQKVLRFPYLQLIGECRCRFYEQTRRIRLVHLTRERLVFGGRFGQ